jgi:glycosyltransferase involved in cell wall biosynthesis
VLPETLARRYRAVLRVNIWLVEHSVAAAVKRLGMSDSVVFLYSPVCAGFIGRLGEVASVYHCVDHYGSFPIWQGSKRRTFIRDAEERMVRSADLVFATSAALTEHCSRFGKEVMELANVADYGLFSEAGEPGPVPVEIASLDGPIVFFHGTFDSNKVDLMLIESLAQLREKWEFVLVGPKGYLGAEASVFERMVGLRNVHWLGFKEQDTLPAYLRGADVLLLPYKRNEHTRHVFPLKFFEYLATGKPLVCTSLASLAAYQEAIPMCVGPMEVVSALDRALQGDEGRDERRRLAGENTWDVRIASISLALEERLGVRIGK